MVSLPLLALGGLGRELAPELSHLVRAGRAWLLVVIITIIVITIVIVMVITSTITNVLTI
jgi:hypothetical protein